MNVRTAHRPSVTRLLHCAAVLALAASGIPAQAATTQADKPAQPTLPTDPAQLMKAMAEALDRHANEIVLTRGDQKIDQGQLADVIRTMPVAMANQGFQAVTQRAMEILLNQQAMIDAAMKEGLDKDPAYLKTAKLLQARALADVWLQRAIDRAVTDQALRSLYDRDYADKPGPEQVRARIILVPSEAEAQHVITRAQSGTDFAELARAYSKHETASKGGDLGYTTEDAVAPEIAHLMFALSPGQVTPFALRTADGYLIVRVEGRSRRAALTFEEARPKLEASLRAEAARKAVEKIMVDVRVTNPSIAPKK
jgi:peptidyl-prolyl cis-trans isomerase C